MASTQLEIGLRCGVIDTHREVLRGSNKMFFYILLLPLLHLKITKKIEIIILQDTLVVFLLLQ